MMEPTPPTHNMRDIVFRAVAKIALWTAPGALLGLTAFLLYHGAAVLSPAFLTSGPDDIGHAGGIGPIILNTIIIVFSAMALAVPVSLAAGLSIAREQISQQPKGRFARMIVLSVDIGSSVPRLLWGLGGAAVFGNAFGLGFSAATGILTLACLLIPLMIANFRDALIVSGEACIPQVTALGINEIDAWIRYALPAATQSILLAISVGTGRACGDAAALLLTAGVSTSLIAGLDLPASTLATHVFILLMEVGGGLQAACASALVLLVLTAVLQAPLLFTTQSNGGSE